MIEGYLGDDVLDGGAGIDTLSFGGVSRGVTVSLAITTAQSISVDEGVDVIRGFENIIGGTYGDQLTGDDQSNYLYGGGFQDTLQGGGGADTLDGDSDADLIYGGDGNDRIIINTGLDTVYGGAGVDSFVVNYLNATPSVIMDWSSEDRIVFSPVARPYTETTAADFTAAKDQATSLIRAGNDVVSVQVGSDVYVFNANYNQTEIGTGVRLAGRSLNDISGENVGTPSAPASAPPPPGAPGLPPPPAAGAMASQLTVTGYMGSAHLKDLLNSTILKTNANEFLADGAGNRIQLIGGPFNYQDPDNLITGPVTDLAYTSNGVVQLTVHFAVAVPSAPFDEWMANDWTYSAFSTLFQNADSMTGSVNAEEIYAYGGNDVIYGGGGGDYIYAGSGADLIYAGAPSGDAPAGATYLRGEDGNDYIVGGTGFDDINGNTGDDTATGGLGDDWVVGGKENDLLFGDQGRDIVYGNIGNDTLSGGDAGDTVRGGQDNDLIYGDAGDDWLSGDRGDDTIVGGAGADTFHSFGNAGVDRIVDFNAAEGDRILLDAGTTYTISQVGSEVSINMSAAGRIILAGMTPGTFNEGWITVG